MWLARGFRTVSVARLASTSFALVGLTAVIFLIGGHRGSIHSEDILRIHGADIATLRPFKYQLENIIILLMLTAVAVSYRSDILIQPRRETTGLFFPMPRSSRTSAL
jgi:hypothetical protein